MKLKMPGLHEAFCLANKQTAYEVWEMLDGLDERVALRWVVPKNGCVSVSLYRFSVWCYYWAVCLGVTEAKFLN